MSEVVNEVANIDDIVKNNSEILFIYDAKMCNPNGDPDDENKPRMDYERGVNLVSDLRLKRYIRDYLANFERYDIFVSKVEGETVDATNRLRRLIEKFKTEIEANENLKKDLFRENKPDEKNLSKHLDWLLPKLIDVRFFGATMPLKSDVGKGASITFTGPVQFNWGYSLNKVSGPMDSSSITSTFAGATEDYSTMGKDYRVSYSLIAFHGIISASRAIATMLTQDDVDTLDKAILKSIPLVATTRSKIGQNPVLYIRIKYTTSEYFLGDLRKYIRLVDEQNNEFPFDDTSIFRSSKDYRLDLGQLCAKLNDNISNIESIYFWKDPNLEITGQNFENQKIIPLLK